MFDIQNKIIIIDNIQTHLDRLAQEFLDCGLGCRTIKYDAFYNTPLKNVRLAFFDINLSEKSIDLNQQEFDYNKDDTLSSVFNDLSNAIKSYISIENGPYALIFWSSNTILINNFIKYVNDRNLDLSKPIVIEGLDKENFLNENESNKEKTIKEIIVSILENTPINLLFDFEEKVNQGVSDTINEIYKLVPNDDEWGKNNGFDKNFELVFSKIAVKTLGLEHAKNNPDKAVYEALLPIINNNLISNIKNGIWKSKLESLQNFNSINNRNINGFKKNSLNTIFHIEKNVINKDARGIVIGIDKNNKETLDSLNIKDYDSWFNCLIPIANSQKRKKTRSTSELIAIEISALCDYSNNKRRINKYLLGVKIPLINRDEDIERNRLSDYSCYVGEFSNNNSEFQIWVNFNYVLSALDSDTRLGEPLFSFKKEIMDMIGNRYANHISRIGITSF